jgi:hypothetical protein
MSDEYTAPADQSAAVTEAPAAPAQEGGSPSSPQSEAGGGQYGGFDTPYAAFRQLPDFAGKDDLAIARTLYSAYNGVSEAQRQLSQYREVVPYANEYLQNRAAYLKWQESQAEASKPKPAEKPKWWNPPSVDESIKSYIIRDPQSGKEVIDPNAPLHAKEALRQYQDYTANFARKFVTDPESTLKPFVEEVAMQKAQELVQQHLNQYQAKNYVQDLEKQNSDWLYNQDGSVSREGQAVQAYIQQASEIGISSPEARWQYATGMLQRDLLNLRYQQMQAAPQMAPPPATQQMAPAYAEPPAADPVAQQNMQFLRERATRTPNRSAGTTEPRAPRQKMSFEDRLRNQLVTDGVI